MRCDLRPQQMQTRVESLSLELTALARERELLMARAKASFCRTIAASAVQGATRTAAKVRSIQSLCSQNDGAPSGVAGRYIAMIATGMDAPTARDCRVRS